MKGLHTFALVLVITFSADADNIFADLSVEEVNQVVEYLGKQSNLKLVAEDVAAVNSSFIYAVEVLQPNKTSALNYLDSGGKKPVKSARVIVMRGAEDPPLVEEYIVSPIPNPSSHDLLKYDSPIPFHARLVTEPDEEAFLELLKAEISKIDHILIATTGFTYSNCTDESDCLTWSYGGPVGYVAEDHVLLISLYRDIEGWTVHNIGLHCALSMPGNDVSKWNVTWVSYRDTTFLSFDAMRDHFKNVTPKKDKNIPADSKSLPSSQNFRGQPMPQDKKRGPKSSYPDGARYTVNDSHIEWLGWSLDFGMPTTTGPRLHDIRFKGERIAYEISLQEIMVSYSGHSAMYAHTRFYDSGYNMGTTYSRMFPGIDCPNQAHFTDSVHYFHGKTKVYENTACIFEMDTGLPLRRHFSSDYKGGYYFYSGMPGNVLVLRTILSVDNYDYIYDFIFHQGGQIQIREAYSGYILTSYYYTPEQDLYGHRVSDDTTLGVLHSHFSHFKVDLDIKGTSNRFRTIQIDMHEYPDPLNKTRVMVNKFINESVKATEKDAAYFFNFETPKYLVVYNEKSKNSFGHQKGYRIINAGQIKQLSRADTFGGKARSWADYQMAITKRNETERASSTIYAWMAQQDPVVNFQDFINDDENILDEDLVAWVTMGAHHLPIAEDIPIVQTPASHHSMYLVPFNYFEEDPSLSSRDHVRVKPAGKKHTYYFSDVPAHDVCNKDDVTCEGTVDGNTSSQTRCSVISVVISVVVLILCFRT